MALSCELTTNTTMALSCDQTTNTIMGWSDLPSEILILIAKRLPNFTDHVRFRSVCPHWRSSFLSQSSVLCLPPQLPWLVLPSAFYSLSEDRVYKIPLPGVPQDPKLYGSISGWVLSIGGSSNHNLGGSKARSITTSLINPFTGARIEMPAPDAGSALSYVATDTLVWDMSESVVVAACTTESGLFYCRFGEAIWSLSKPRQDYIYASSITFYDDRFYFLVDLMYHVVVLDGETLEQITVIQPLLMYSPVQAHLSRSSGGDLLLLLKFTSKNSHLNNDSHYYMVWRIDRNGERAHWVGINDIGDHALLIG